MAATSDVRTVCTASTTAGSTITLTADTLDAGDTTECTRTYTVTQADIDAGGSLRNTATASGNRPEGAAVTSDPATASLPIAPPVPPSPSPTRPTPAEPPLPTTGYPLGAWIAGAFAVFASGVLTLWLVRRRRHGRH